jgi:DNA-directed RNA polymerase specialized sigma24 family protein
MAATPQQVKERGRPAAPPRRDVGAALATLSEEDLLRLRTLARLRARCLPPGAMSWRDLLHEAALRALTGARPWPQGVPLLAFLAGVMRSLCDEQWRRYRRRDDLPTSHGSGEADDPERVCAAAEALAAIQRLFASDKAALKVIKGLISGMTAEDIRRHYDMTAAEYDTTRRRIRPDDTASRFGLVVAMTRTAYPQSRLTALLDALERELLAAPADEVRDAWREAGRAGNIACQEVRELLNEAIATSEDSSAATPWRDTSAETGLDQLFGVSRALRAAPRDPHPNALPAWRPRRH